MELGDVSESGNVEDRRGMGGKMAIGGGIGAVILTIIGLITGGAVNLGGRGGGGGGGGGGAPADPETKAFVAKILTTTETVWKDEFQKEQYENVITGRPVGPYREPKLVLFSDEVETGCGTAPSAVGPFYCPADKTVYLDPTFFQELEQKLGGSKGQFSQGYVIAHEVGHHVQNLIGYNEKVERERRRGKEAGNHASVRLELMADYLAGVWAHHGQKQFHFIQEGEFNEAITSAKSIGDDRLQKRAGQFVHPEQFTHGTSRQRVYFFNRGFKTGDATRATLDKFFSVPMRGNGEIEDF
jgi:predicted metalloprotease